MPYFGASHPSSIARREPNNDYHLARTSHSSPIGHASALHQSSNVRGGSGSPSRPQQPARKSSLNVQSKSVKTEPTNLPPKRFADTLSHEERMTRMDALLDIMEPTDLVDMFWKKTDVALRYLMMIFPDAEKGKFLVNAVSFSCNPASRRRRRGLILVCGESRLATSMYPHPIIPEAVQRSMEFTLGASNRRNCNAIHSPLRDSLYRMFNPSSLLRRPADEIARTEFLRHGGCGQTFQSGRCT